MVGSGHEDHLICRSARVAGPNAQSYVEMSECRLKSASDGLFQMRADLAIAGHKLARSLKAFGAIDASNGTNAAPGRDVLPCDGGAVGSSVDATERGGRRERHRFGRP